MNLLSYHTFWNAIISLTTTKKMLELSLKKCCSCKKTILEAALDDYVGKMNKCPNCRKYYSKIINFWIEFLRLSLSVRRDKIEKLLEDPYTKRAIITLVKSFLYFGIRKPLSIYAPFLVVWDFTHKCNLNCKHCYSNSGLASEKELKTKEALDVVNQLADFGVTALAFSGGEPLSRSDFFEVAEHAVKNVLSILLDLDIINVIGRGEERYAPAKCLEGLSLQDIMRRLRTYGVTDQREGRDDAITRLVDEIQSQYDIALKQAFDEASLRDLLDKIIKENN